MMKSTQLFFKISYKILNFLFNGPTKWIHIWTLLHTWAYCVQTRSSPQALQETTVLLEQHHMVQKYPRIALEPLAIADTLDSSAGIPNIRTQDSQVVQLLFVAVF